MDSRDQARFEMVKRVGTFGTNNAADFTSPTPTPVQTKALQLFGRLNNSTTGLIAAIGANATSQQAGAGTFHSGTTSKGVQRDALLLDLRALNRTAAAIAETDHTPGLMEHFRMPYGMGQAALGAKARAIVAKAGSMSARFIELGHDATFVADLGARITAFEQEDTGQSQGLQTQAGATGAFDSLVNEALTVVKQLDAIMHNFYKSNAAKLGEWKTASHTERAPKRKDDAPPAPPTT